MIIVLVILLFSLCCQGGWIFQVRIKDSSLANAQTEYIKTVDRDRLAREIQKEESEYLYDPVYVVNRISWLEYITGVYIEAEDSDHANQTLSRLWWWSVQINCLEYLKVSYLIIMSLNLFVGRCVLRSHGKEGSRG